MYEYTYIYIYIYIFIYRGRVNPAIRGPCSASIHVYIYLIYSCSFFVYVLFDSPLVRFFLSGHLQLHGSYAQPG